MVLTIIFCKQYLPLDLGNKTSMHNLIEFNPYYFPEHNKINTFLFLTIIHVYVMCSDASYKTNTFCTVRMHECKQARERRTQIKHWEVLVGTQQTNYRTVKRPDYRRATVGQYLNYCLSLPSNHILLPAPSLLPQIWAL